MTRRVLVLALVLSAGGCAAPRANWSDVGGVAQAEAEIYEVTLRYVTRYYDPSGRAPGPAAFCVAVGRRSAQALRDARRSEDEVWVPSVRLLSRLGDLHPPVVSIVECEQNDEVEEIHRPTGDRAVVVTVERPTFESPDRAITQVRTRENASYVFSYRCELRRRDFGWEMRLCL